MELATGVVIDDEVLAEFCRANGIQSLRLFGSALADDLGPHSDVDLLVEFQADRIPGLLEVARLELELAAMIGREVDLRTLRDLSRYFRDDVAAQARPLYVAA